MKILGIVEEAITDKSTSLATEPPLTDEIMTEFNRDRRDRPEEQLVQKNGCLVVPNHRIQAWGREGYSGQKMTELLSTLLTKAETAVNERDGNTEAAKAKQKASLEKAFGLPVKPLSEFVSQTPGSGGGQTVQQSQSA